MSWVSETCKRITSLRGRRIEQAIVVEMALVQEGPDELPIFRHSAAPFIQAVKIELALDDGRFALFSNYQNEEFPIAMDYAESSSMEPHWAEPTYNGEPSIYRFAPTPNFPLGLITAAEARLNNDGDISEVAITVENNKGSALCRRGHRRLGRHVRILRFSWLDFDLPERE